MTLWVFVSVYASNTSYNTKGIMQISTIHIILHSICKNMVSVVTGQKPVHFCSIYTNPAHVLMSDLTPQTSPFPLQL